MAAEVMWPSPEGGFSLLLDVCSCNLEGCDFICHLFSPPHLDCVRINCNTSKSTFFYLQPSSLQVNVDYIACVLDDVRARDV